MKLRLLIVMGSIFLLGACKQNVQTVVVAGDSWASLMCGFKSFDRSFRKAGMPTAMANSTCLATTQTGMRAENWLDSTPDKATRIALMDASVKVLYLSLGGNDVLNKWHKDLSREQEQELFDEVVSRIGAIVTTYRMARPDIKILVSGYDYPRFIDNHPISAYRKAYEEMRKPTPEQLNLAILRFSEAVSRIADQKQVFYIHHYGLMHYHYGNSEAGLEPFKTMPPSLISSPDQINRAGGAINLMSDVKAMAKVGDVNPVVDAFHLGKGGYDRLVEHSILHYLKDWLKEPSTTN